MPAEATASTRTPTSERADERADERIDERTESKRTPTDRSTGIKTSEVGTRSRNSSAHLPRVAIAGATGYSGRELASILWTHPHVDLIAGTSRRAAGQQLCDLVGDAPALPLIDPEELGSSSPDIAFLCMPSGQGGSMAAELCAKGVRVIDLSGDHRIRSKEIHEEVYGCRRAQALAETAAYGLTEHFRDDIVRSSFVANPGCYPTSVLTALLPVQQEDLITDIVMVDAKSGVSGAGVAPSERTHFCTLHGNVAPYKPGRSHRHVAEMEQCLKTGKVLFNPHLVPVERGLLSTICISTRANADQVRDLLSGRYDNEPFVRVLKDPEAVAEMAMAVGTNGVVISVHEVRGSDHVVLVSAIDNLQKGAAGQAVQNMNLMLGMPEPTGLKAPFAVQAQHFAGISTDKEASV